MKLHEEKNIVKRLDDVLLFKMRAVIFDLQSFLGTWFFF